jgi:hypothetical protein
MAMSGSKLWGMPAPSGSARALNSTRRTEHGGDQTDRCTTVRRPFARPRESLEFVMNPNARDANRRRMGVARRGIYALLVRRMRDVGNRWEWCTSRLCDSARPRTRLGVTSKFHRADTRSALSKLLPIADSRGLDGAIVTSAQETAQPVLVLAAMSHWRLKVYKAARRTRNVILVETRRSMWSASSLPTAYRGVGPRPWASLILFRIVPTPTRTGA